MYRIVTVSKGAVIKIIKSKVAKKILKSILIVLINEKIR
jgi:hypothetical protein